MANGQNNSRIGYLQFLAMALLIFLISACGGGDEANNHIATKPGTGDLSFNVVFQNTSGGIQRQAAVIDCAGLGIATVEAMVYDQGNNFIVRSEAWRCDSGQGTITAVPAGSGRIVAILAKDGDGNIVLRGQKTDVNVVAGKDNNAGTIMCNAFIASLIYPENESIVPADAAELQWDAVAGASEYFVIVSKNDDLSDSFINTAAFEGSYTLSNLIIGETYFWQVVAGDGDGNKGIESPIWSFTTKDNNNMIQDPTFELTESNTDTRYWWLDHSDSDVEWNTFDVNGQIDVNGNPAIKINNVPESNGSWLWEKNPPASETLERFFPIQGGDTFHFEASVFESTDSDADNPRDFRAGIWAEDNNNLYQSFNSINLRPSAKGRWEIISGDITIFKPNPDDYVQWDSTSVYNFWDVIKYDTDGTGSYVAYRCLADATSGVETEPPNSKFWARYDNPQLGKFGILSEKCTEGYFLVDDLVLYKINSDGK